MIKKVRPHSSNTTATRLLDIAEALFSEHGYAITTVRDIATRAKVNQALISYHFQNKKGLFNAVFERRASIILEERNTLLSEAKARAKNKPIPCAWQTRIREAKALLSCRLDFIMNQKVLKMPCAQSCMTKPACASWKSSK
jgi:AcrR family transcriptional regulator